jgi:hypothetical protein
VLGRYSVPTGTSKAPDQTTGGAAIGAGGGASGCAETPRSTVQLGQGAVVTAYGHGPVFFFGPFEPSTLSVGDLNKVPWEVSPRYTGLLVVRGEEILSHSIVTFGFYPPGQGTPSQEPSVPVVRERRESDGRVWVYQPELHIAPGPPDLWRQNGHPWSFAQSGCYAIRGEGAGFTEVTIVRR